MRVIVIAIISAQIAQVTKVFTHYAKSGKWDFNRYFQASGMPSAHSAVVSSVVTTVGYLKGYDSVEFGISFAVAFIVIYDATNVRYQAGLHAKILNEIVDEKAMIKYQEKAKVAKPKNKLKELIGHTLSEALAGIVLGVVVSQILIHFWR
jgi:acid phosphatase family membrane protein YuiD